MNFKELLDFIIKNLSFEVHKRAKKPSELNPPEIRPINSYKDGKVFCNNCKFIKKTDGATGEIIENVFHIWGHSYYVCKHPNFLEIKYDEDSFLVPAKGKIHSINYSSCSKINGKNDCKFFEGEK
jgi:hypothetical protein